MTSFPLGLLGGNIMDTHLTAVPPVPWLPRSQHLTKTLQIGSLGEALGAGACGPVLSEPGRCRGAA